MKGRFDSLPSFECGTRSCYVQGCRCALCRAANTAYARRREAQRLEQLAELDANRVEAEQLLGPAGVELAPQLWTAPDGTRQARFYRRACPGVGGEPCPKASHLRKDSKGGRCGVCRNKLTTKGLVPADRARAHLLSLSKLGVGRRAVAAASDVGDTTLQYIRNGTSTQIAADTERRILSVDQNARADSSHVDAAPTRKALRQLRRKYGWTKTAIAAALGSKAKIPALQLQRGKVLARSELAVKQLLERAAAEHRARRAAEKERKKFFLHQCPRCGQYHTDDPTAAAWCLSNLHVPVDALEVA